MKRFKWTLEIEVSETWVADGFDLTDERALAMLANDLAHAFGHEIGAKVIARPDMGDVNEAQGDARERQREGWPLQGGEAITADAITDEQIIDLHWTAQGEATSEDPAKREAAFDVMMVASNALQRNLDTSDGNGTWNYWRGRCAEILNARRSA